MSIEEYRRALELWREYDRTQRSLTARLFNGRDHPQSIQRLLDENEQRLNAARELTNRLLRGSAGDDPAAPCPRPADAP